MDGTVHRDVERAPRILHIFIQSLGPVVSRSRVRYCNTYKVVVHAYYDTPDVASWFRIVVVLQYRTVSPVRDFVCLWCDFTSSNFQTNTTFYPLLRSKMYRLFLVLCLCYGLPDYASSEETTNVVYEHCGNLQLQENIQIKLVRVSMTC